MIRNVLIFKFIKIDNKKITTRNFMDSPKECEVCKNPHDGERISEIDKYKDCLFKKCFVEWGGTARCMTSDGRNVNMAEELNRLEKELIE
jgi:hypothetical protein